MKCRTCAADDYPTVIVEVAKAATVMRAGRWLRVPACIVFAYADGAARWLSLDKLDTVPIAATVRGRTDRGDPDDLDPCFMVPRELFGVLP
jgi:hypothetical protein